MEISPTSEHSAHLRKAIIASTIGTTIEWYDFFIYGTAAGLVFGKLFFPNEDPLTATLAAFGTYFIGFIGRPIGSDTPAITGTVSGASANSTSATGIANSLSHSETDGDASSASAFTILQRLRRHRRGRSMWGDW